MDQVKHAKVKKKEKGDCPVRIDSEVWFEV